MVSLGDSIFLLSIQSIPANEHGDHVRSRHFRDKVDIGSDDVTDATLKGARLLHFGYPPLMRRMYADRGEELSSIYRQAKATGVTTSLDMALPDVTGPSGRVDWPALLRDDRGTKARLDLKALVRQQTAQIGIRPEHITAVNLCTICHTDLFYSYRSPYSYLALPRTMQLVAEYDLTVNLRPVYPLAVRVPGFFKKTNPKFARCAIRRNIGCNPPRNIT